MTYFEHENLVLIARSVELPEIEVWAKPDRSEFHHGFSKCRYLLLEKRHYEKVQRKDWRGKVLPSFEELFMFFGWGLEDLRFTAQENEVLDSLHQRVLPGVQINWLTFDAGVRADILNKLRAIKLRKARKRITRSAELAAERRGQVNLKTSKPKALKSAHISVRVAYRAESGEVLWCCQGPLTEDQATSVLAELSNLWVRPDCRQAGLKSIQIADVIKNSLVVYADTVHWSNRHIVEGDLAAFRQAKLPAKRVDAGS